MQTNRTLLPKGGRLQLSLLSTHRFPLLPCGIIRPRIFQNNRYWSSRTTISASLGSTEDAEAVNISDASLAPDSAEPQPETRTKGNQGSKRRAKAVAIDFNFTTCSKEELVQMHVKLKEDDVDYQSLKSYCRQLKLGGKDTKDNMRAKLLKVVRDRLGYKLTWDNKELDLREFRAPNEMAEAELEDFFRKMNIVAPEARITAENLAFALLVAYGVLSQADVPNESNDYKELTVDQLKQICHDRGLPVKGRRDELENRLSMSDNLIKEKEAKARSEKAFKEELRKANINRPPKPPNRPLEIQLENAQEELARAQIMELPDLRLALLRRGLPVYGTREVLVDRVTEVLRKDVVDALGGSVRLMKYAQAAVMKLSQAETERELDFRGLLSDFAVQEEAALKLRNELVDQWVYQALHSRTGLTFDEGEEEESGEDGEEDEAGTAGGTMTIALVCGGLTPDQRDHSLASVRSVLPHLQTDVLWGTLPPDVPFQPDLAGFYGDTEDVTAPPDATAAFVDYPVWGANGFQAELESSEDPACTFMVVATPLDGAPGAKDLTFHSPVSTVPLNGLQPGTTYQLTPYLRNAAGAGPAGESIEATTTAPSGGVCWVYYPVEITPGSGNWQYVKLSWKEVYGCTAAELDARLAVPTTVIDAVFIDDIASNSGVLLPLGLLPQTTSEEANAWRLATDRTAFTQALSNLGFNAANLMKLTMAELQENADAAGKRINDWLAAQNLDPAIVRVAVRAEVGGDVLGAGVGKGAEEIIAGAVDIMEDLNTDTVVLEALIPGAVFVTCTVLSTPQGPVALPPTEVDVYDLQQEIARSELRYQKFLARREGMAADAVEAMCVMWEEDLKVHPEVVGGATSLTEELRHCTPPTSLHAAASSSIRSTAVKLFQSLDLKDYAQFSGWVVPEDPYTAAGLTQTLDLITKLRAAEQEEEDRKARGDPSAQELQLAAAKQTKSFAELAEIDRLEREARDAQLQEITAAANAAAELVAATGGSDAAAVMASTSFFVPSEQRGDLDVEVNSQKASGLGEDVGPYGVAYGEFEGVKIDTTTRLDLIKANLAAPAKPFPSAPPPLTQVERLEAEVLAGANPQTVSQAAGYRVAFDKVTLAPDFGSFGGPLVQQAAAAGLSMSAVAHTIVSAAAVRAGLPPLIPPPSAPDSEDDIAWRPGRAAHSFGSDIGGGFISDASGSSMQEIGDALAEWTQPERLPELDSYDDILRYNDKGELEPAAPAEEEAAAAAAAALDDNPYPGLEDDTDVDDDVLDEEDDPAAVLMRRFPGLHPTRQRVWVLLGGEGPDRDAGVQSALHSISVLSMERDLQVEAFMLEPPHAGTRDEERRHTMLSRRIDMMEIGANDEQLLAGFTEYHPSRIKHPEAEPPQDLDWRGVWCLGSSNVVRPSVTDIHIGCEAALIDYSSPVWTRTEGDALHVKDDMLNVVRKELELAGLPVVGKGQGPWGGSSLESGEPPEYCFLNAWVEAAAKQCAVVLLAVPSHPSAQGPLQALLERKGVPFTGCAATAAELCADRAELLKKLSEIAYPGSGISTPPFHTISLPELAAKCENELTADELVARLSDHWGLTEKPLVIRPLRDSSGRGIARIANGADLQQYTQAVQSWADAIPRGSLVLEDDDILMSFPPPTSFVLEPCPEVMAPTLVVDTTATAETAHTAGNDAVGVDGVLGTDPYALHAGLQWPQTWLKVTACLLGSSNHMRCLGLTTSALCTVTLPDGSVRESALDLTPPPAALLPPRIASKTRGQVQLLAGQLGLSGAAEITAMINPNSGDMVVLEVQPLPDLSPDGVLMRQAAAVEGSSPLSATQVLRELLKAGMSRGEENSYHDMLPYADDFSTGIQELLEGRAPEPPGVSNMGSPYSLLDVEDSMDSMDALDSLDALDLAEGSMEE